VIEARLPVAVDSVVDTEQSPMKSTAAEYDTVCQPQNKRMRLMDSDSDTDDCVESVAEEVARLKLEKKLPNGEDPLMWWKMNDHHFFQIGSSCKERSLCTGNISSAGYIVNKRRSALAPHTVNMLVCLRYCIADTEL